MAGLQTRGPRGSGFRAVRAAGVVALIALLGVGVAPAAAQQAQAPAAPEQSVTPGEEGAAATTEAAAVEEPSTAPEAAAGPTEDGRPRPAAASPTVLSEEEVAARIADAYNVEVLQVARSDLIGGPAYAVKVMVPGGDSNAAFMVSTLMVDGVTGKLIPQFRHRTWGYRPSGALTSEPGVDAAGEALRLRTFRAGPEAIQ